MEADSMGDSKLRSRKYQFWMSPGFGLETVGLLPLRKPVLAIVLLAVTLIIGVAGAMRAKSDDALRDLFRSKTAAYTAIVL